MDEKEAREIMEKVLEDPDLQPIFKELHRIQDISLGLMLSMCPLILAGEHEALIDGIDKLKKHFDTILDFMEKETDSKGITTKQLFQIAAHNNSRRYEQEYPIFVKLIKGIKARVEASKIKEDEQCVH